MVHGVARERQPPALDRVGEHDRRARRIPIGGVEGADDLVDIVAAEVGEDRREGLVGHVRHRSRKHVAVRFRRTLEEAAPGLRARLADEDLVLLVGHVVDPPTQDLAARPGEDGLQPAAVFRLEDLPAGRREHSLEAADPDPGHHPVEALAVDVDDDRDVAEAAQGILVRRLPDVALVELGVADEGDEATLQPGQARVRAVELQIAIGERCEERRNCAQPDRAGREVDPIWILRPGRV